MGERSCSQLGWFYLLRHAVCRYWARIRHGSHCRRHHQGRHGQHLYNVEFVSPWWKLKGSFVTWPKRILAVTGDGDTGRGTRSWSLINILRSVMWSDWEGMISDAWDLCEVQMIVSMPRNFVNNRSKITDTVVIKR